MSIVIRHRYNYANSSQVLFTASYEIFREGEKVIFLQLHTDLIVLTLRRVGSCVLNLNAFLFVKDHILIIA